MMAVVTAVSVCPTCAVPVIVGAPVAAVLVLVLISPLTSIWPGPSLPSVRTPVASWARVASSSTLQPGAGVGSV